MLRIGFTIESYKGLEPSFLLGIIKFFGVEFVEITKTVFDDIERVIPKMHGLQAGFHLPLIHDDGWDFSCVDSQPDIDAVIENINRYKDDLHIKYCVTHPPEPWNSAATLHVSVEQLLKNLRRLQVPIFLENVPHGSYDEYLRVYERAKAVLGDQLSGMCYDGPHYFVSGMNPVTRLQELNGEIGCIHLSDCMHDDDTHLPFDSGGEFPTEEVIAQIKRMKFDGFINLEIKPRSLSDLDSVIYSYLKMLKPFRKGKYFRTKLKLMVLRPLMKRFL